MQKGAARLFKKRSFTIFILYNALLLSCPCRQLSINGHQQRLLYSVPCLISSSHRKTGPSACRMSQCHLLDIPIKKLFHQDMYHIMRPNTPRFLLSRYGALPATYIYVIFLFPRLFAAGIDLLLSLILEAFGVFFFKALNISKVKSVDTSLESLLSLFSSQGILNLSAVDNRKPNSLLSVIPYLACGGQLGEVALGNTIFRHILDSFCRRSWKHYDQKIYLQYKSNSFQICFAFLIFFTTDITNILR